MFDVHDAELGANVALKWLRNSDSSTLQRFKREFRSLADLVHPNLVRYRELLTVAGEWFFTMDLVDGGVEIVEYVRSSAASGLDSPQVPTATDGDGASGGVVVQSTINIQNPLVIKAPPTGSPHVGANGAPPRASEGSFLQSALPAPPHRPFCFADFRRLRHSLEQLGEGLDALHAGGLIHRDIKPSNVLVTGDGRVVILDLGLVTEIGKDGVDVSKSGLVVGTPAYMSPEQALGKRLTSSSDWYSVGVILYQALTAKLPFEGSGHALLMKKQLEKPISPSELVRGIPKELSELCLDLLNRAPELRPVGVEFRERLGRAIEKIGEHADKNDAFRISQSVSSSSLRPSKAPTHLVGREAHLFALEEALDESIKGSTTVIARVPGLSGLGKTTIVRHFLDHVRRTQPNALVLEGRCYERESVPYKALDSLIDALCRYLSRLPEVEMTKLLPRDMEALGRIFPVLMQLASPTRRRMRAPVDAHEERRRAFEALKELLSRVADRNPLVLFIDDLQWGDADSEPLLLTLLSEPDPPPMLFIAAYRSEDADKSPLVLALRSVESNGHSIETCEIPIKELSPEDSRDLARALLGTRAREREDSAIATLATEAFGSPLFLRQLAAFEEEEETRVNLPKAIAKRVATLPADACRLLNTLAVAGRPLPLALAARVADIEQDAPGIVSRLRAETLVRTRGVDASGEVEVYHDRIRDIVMKGLPPEEAKRLHMKLGRALSAEGDAADAEAIATHFKLADQVALAAQYAEKAADRASNALAFGRAAAMYEMAIELQSGVSEGSSEGSDVLLLKLAEALVSAGRNREAADRFLQMAEGASPMDALELRRRAAEQMLFSGQLALGMKIIEQLLDAMKMSTPTTPLAVVCSLLWRRFLLFVRGLRYRERSLDELPRELIVRIDTCFSLGAGLGMVDPVRGADFQTRYLLLALDAGEPQRIARGFAVEAVYRASEGVRRRETVERLLTKASSLAERVSEPALIGLVKLIRGGAAFLMGENKKALELCDESISILRSKASGVTFEIDNASLLSDWALLALGRIKELGERLPGQLDDARSRGNLYGETLLRLQCGWFMHLAKDDVVKARADLGSLGEEWILDRAVLQRLWQILNGVSVDLYELEPKRAFESISAGYLRMKAARFLRAEGIRVQLTDARARAALAYANEDASKRAEMLGHVERHISELHREVFPSARGLRLLLEAGVAIVGKQDHDKAIEILREALAELEEKGLGLHASAVRYRLGQLLGGTEGSALVQRAEKDLRDEGVARPERMVRVFAPFDARVRR